MKKSKLFYLLLIGLPFLTLPLLGKKAIRQFTPAALFICMVTKVIDHYGRQKKWWKFYKGIPLFNSMNFFNFGPYFVSSLWILRFTYQKYPLYLLTNLIIHISFSFFGGLTLVDKYKIFTLKKMSKIQYLFLNTFRAILLYGFQHLVHSGRKKY